jgi:hypothetical protein
MNKHARIVTSDHTTTRTTITNVGTLRKHLNKFMNDLQMFRQNMMDDHKDAIAQFELSRTFKGNFCNKVERTKLHLQWWR